MALGFSSGARPAVARVCLCVRSTLERGEQWAALCLPFWQDIYLKGKSNQSGRRAADCKPRRRLSKGRLRWLFIRCRAPFSRVQTIYIYFKTNIHRGRCHYTHIRTCDKMHHVSSDAHAPPVWFGLNKVPDRIPIKPSYFDLVPQLSCRFSCQLWLSWAAAGNNMTTISGKSSKICTVQQKHTHTKIESYVFELQMQVSCLWLCFGNIVDRSDHSVVEATAAIPLRELHAYFSHEMSTQIIGQHSSNYWRWAVDPVTDAQGCFSCKLMSW